jgi:hypothetical protein
LPKRKTFCSRFGKWIGIGLGSISDFDNWNKEVLDLVCSPVVGFFLFERTSGLGLTFENLCDGSPGTDICQKIWAVSPFGDFSPPKKKGWFQQVDVNSGPGYKNLTLNPQFLLPFKSDTLTTPVCSLSSQDGTGSSFCEWYFFYWFRISDIQ